jgi:N-sulfoglucosamine sulfohydrolase
LANVGYRTARVGKLHVSPEEVYHFKTTIQADPRNPVEMANACRDFIADSDSGSPFFLYFAPNDPHRGDEFDKTSTLELKPNLFGNLPNGAERAGVKQVKFEAQSIPVPKFLTDSPETRAELAHYYQACARVDQGVGALVKILKETSQFDKTLIVFTSDHGMPFAGAKTTVYDAGLRVPMVVRNPYQKNRDQVSQALVSHIDIAPTLLDFAGGLDHETGGPKAWQNPDQFWFKQKQAVKDNRSGGLTFRRYQGKSWLSALEDPSAEHWDALLASQTFHEIQMYYPMRAVRDKKYKLIWNIAHPLEFPFANDLVAAASWQAQFRQGKAAPYGFKSVEEYLHRPEFEFYDIQHDPDEARNLADQPEFAERLSEYKKKLRKLQTDTEDPWVSAWDRQ